MIRTFIAIDVPDEVKSEMMRMQEALRKLPGNRISWTRPQGIHLTLKFLGDIPENEIDDIANVLESALLDQNRFEIQTTLTGGFPNLKRPRVLWLGVDGGDELINIHRRVDKGLYKLGFDKEKKRFNPHLTIGRAKELNPRSDLPSKLQGYNLEPRTWEVEHVRVMASQLKPTGAVYTVLATLPI